MANPKQALGGFAAGFAQGFGNVLLTEKQREYDKQQKDRENRLKFIQWGLETGNIDDEGAASVMAELFGGGQSAKGAKAAKGGKAAGGSIPGNVGQMGEMLPVLFGLGRLIDARGGAKSEQAQGQVPSATQVGAPGAASTPQAGAAPAGAPQAGGIPHLLSVEEKAHRQVQADRIKSEGMVENARSIRRQFPNLTLEESLLAAGFKLPSTGSKWNSKEITGDLLPPNTIDARTGNPIADSERTKDKYFISEIGPDGTPSGRVLAVKSPTSGATAKLEEQITAIMSTEGLSREEATKKVYSEFRQGQVADLMNKLESVTGKRLSNAQKQMLLTGQLTAKDATDLAVKLLQGTGREYTAEDISKTAQIMRTVAGQLGGTAPRPATTDVTPKTPAAKNAPTPKKTPTAAPTGAPADQATFGKAPKLSAEEQKTIDTIGSARPMIGRVEEMLKDKAADNTLGSRIHAGVQSLEYYAGFQPGDPTYQELIPLANLLRVLITTPYMRGMRNVQYVKQIQEHIPAPTDTPALIMDKLKNIKKTFVDLETAMQPQPGRVGNAQVFSAEYKGKSYTFPTQAKLDAFKRMYGIQ